MCLFSLGDERFCWKKSFQYLIFGLVTLTVLRNRGCCNGQNLQRSWGFAPDPTWWVYTSPYDPMRFSLREKDKSPLCPSKVWDFPTDLNISWSDVTANYSNLHISYRSCKVFKNSSKLFIKSLIIFFWYLKWDERILPQLIVCSKKK